MQSKLWKSDGDDGGGLSVSLPEDIILEVLHRLPGKALRRFRCVSKGWRTLFSDPSFIAARRSRGHAVPLIVAVFGSAPELELRLLDDVGNVLRVFDVGAGPALLAPTRLDLIFVDRMQLGAVIIDPASRRDFTVVGTEDPPRPLWDRSTSTAMNDYSFGRAVPSGDYKVLRLHVIDTFSLSSVRRFSHWCEVATILDVGTKPTWRRRQWGPFYQTSFSCKHKATVNGVLYLMLDDDFSASDGRRPIAAFNLESEQWRPQKIKGPLLRCNNMEENIVTLTELKGSLCFVHTVQHLADLGGHYASIWLLKDPNRSVWVKVHKIQMPEKLLFSKPLDVLIDGRLLLLNMFRKAGNTESCRRYILQFYDSSTKAFTDFMEMAEGFNGRIAFYTGSLQS